MTNRIVGLLYKRIPKSDIAIVHVIIFVIYIGVNVGCLFISPVVPASFGTLIAANAFLIILPATRSSILLVLTGELWIVIIA